MSLQFNSVQYAFYEVANFRYDMINNLHWKTG